MKTKPFAFIFLLFIAGALFGSPAFADPPGRVGRLSYISGPVSLAPAGLDNEWSLAVINRPVTTGDHLWSDEGARAEVHVGSTAIRLGTRTSVDVLNLDDRITQLRIVQGTLNVRVRQVAPDGLFEIDTPSAAILVRQPGSYRIEVDPNGRQTTVSVRFGEVNVSGPNANFLLYNDQQATLFSDSSNYDLTRLPPLDSFDRFCLERDQRQDSFRSESYVPYEMTGYEELDTYGSWATVSTYGTVWFPSHIAADWAPYRDGRWMWVEPWGWTWIDSAPWGFAPFHYGRWAYIHGRWGWCPGDVRARPVYAPALVAFVGGSGFSAAISIASGPVVSWFPLGYQETYVPWYSVSPTYIRQVNKANVSKITHATSIDYANRNVPSAITAVSGTVFTQSRMVAPSRLRTPAMHELARAPIIHGGAPITPVRQSLTAGPATAVRPPETVASRPAIAINTPPPHPAPFATRQAEIAKQPGKPFQVRTLTAAPGAALDGKAPVRIFQPPHVVNPQPAVQSNSGLSPGSRVIPQPQTGQSSGQAPFGVPSRPPEAIVPKEPAGIPTNAPHPPPRIEGQVHPATPGAVLHPPQAEERAQSMWQPAYSPAMKAPEIQRLPQTEEHVRPPIPQSPRNERHVQPETPVTSQPSQNLPSSRAAEHAQSTSPLPQPHSEARPGTSPQAAPAPHEQGNPSERRHPPDKDKEKREENR
jgi:hypothetical protein